MRRAALLLPCLLAACGGEVKNDAKAKSATSPLDDLKTAPAGSERPIATEPAGTTVRGVSRRGVCSFR